MLDKSQPALPKDSSYEVPTNTLYCTSYTNNKIYTPETASRKLGCYSDSEGCAYRRPEWWNKLSLTMYASIAKVLPQFLAPKLFLELRSFMFDFETIALCLSAGGFWLHVPLETSGCIQCDCRPELAAVPLGWS